VKAISNAVKVGILALLMVLGSYGVWKSIGQKPSGSNNYDMWSKFRDASGMPVGSRVVVAGLPVGEIEGLSIDGRYARVNFRVRKDVQVYANAVVYKKSTSLLGDYYLEIDPGSPESVSVTGETQTNRLLGKGDQIVKVVEATSPDQLMRRIEESLPNVDQVLLSVRDLSEDLRRVVNGPLASIADRIDDLVQKESETIEAILAKADRSLARIEQITRDVRNITGGADEQINSILNNLDEASSEAKTLITSARTEVEETGKVVREKLDLVDELLASSASVASKIDDPDTGTLSRLVNDTTLADNLEDITEDTAGFVSTLFGMQTYVGLRSEYNVFAGLARHYVTMELRSRPDKYYLIELEKGPRGAYPTVTLINDPSTGDQWVRRTVIEDKLRFTFQFAKRINWATFRYGIKESTGGVGVDLHSNWLNRGLELKVDLFDATFDQLPRLKMTAVYELFKNIYILGGVDEALNPPDTLNIATGDTTTGVPIQFEDFRFGRDYFMGAMVKFNDKDLSALLFLAGATVAAIVE
jgi:phospholipid/cholesterol/gamma-HCH transport system substrate-binding protein